MALFVNGINAETGAYLSPRLHKAKMKRLVQEVLRAAPAPSNLAAIDARAQAGAMAFLAPRFGVDPRRLDESGWGVILPAFSDAQAHRRAEVPAIKEALQPLLDLRAQQAGARFDAWTSGTTGRFHVGQDDARQYLARHGMGAGHANPDKIPYYLLIVGSPADIPFSFQEQMDVDYAVGRIHFDTLDEYAAYAASVVAAERNLAPVRKSASFFSVINPNDKFTAASHRMLMSPLAKQIKEEYPDWNVNIATDAEAKKADLQRVLDAEHRPGLLVTSSHGMSLSAQNVLQRQHQGALICGDWPGESAWQQAIPQDFYFAADDLDANANLSGLIALFVACYGAGTPQMNGYAQYDAWHAGVNGIGNTQIAPEPFVAQLPRAMLSRPQGGALAVVGHVERLWTTSFDGGPAGPQIDHFLETIQRLFEGYPIGSAIEPLNERYASVASQFHAMQMNMQFDFQYEPFDVVYAWTAANDARGYSIVGDPAVRLVPAD